MYQMQQNTHFRVKHINSDDLRTASIFISDEYKIFQHAVCDFCQNNTTCVASNNKKLCQDCVYNCVSKVNMGECKVCLETKNIFVGLVCEECVFKCVSKMFSVSECKVCLEIKNTNGNSVCSECVYECVLQNSARNSWIEQNGDPISLLHKDIAALKDEIKLLKQ